MERLLFPLSEKEAAKLGVQVHAEDNKNAVFPTRLRALRIAKKLSQAELATKLEVTKSTIGLYEVGGNVPDVKTLARIVKFFDVSADWLIGPEGIDTTDEAVQAASELTGHKKESVEKLRDMNVAGDIFVCHLLDLLIEDLELIRAFGAYLYETRDIAPKLINKGDSKELQEHYREVAENDRLHQVKKCLIEFKQARRDKIRGETYGKRNQD